MQNAKVKMVRPIRSLHPEFGIEQAIEVTERPVKQLGAVQSAKCKMQKSKCSGQFALCTLTFAL
jgi:hypothetical protein